MTEALLPRIAGEGDREAVEGATPTTCGSLAPSTTLRVVPLPLFEEEEISPETP